MHASTVAGATNIERLVKFKDGIRYEECINSTGAIHGTYGRSQSRWNT